MNILLADRREVSYSGAREKGRALDAFDPDDKANYGNEYPNKANSTMPLAICRAGVNSHATMCRPYGTEIEKNVL